MRVTNLSSVLVLHLLKEQLLFSQHHMAMEHWNHLIVRWSQGSVIEFSSKAACLRGLGWKLHRDSNSTLARHFALQRVTRVCATNRHILLSGTESYKPSLLDDPAADLRTFYLTLQLRALTTSPHRAIPWCVFERHNIVCWTALLSYDLPLILKFVGGQLWNAPCFTSTRPELKLTSSMDCRHRLWAGRWTV
eukprot:6263920-Amphidinium_carterae.1